MTAQPLALAIVGCGDVARFTAFFARFNRGIRLVACCDTSLERAAAFARRYRIPQSYTSYDEMLRNAQLDATYLAVPHHLHAPMTLAAIAAGVAVLLEKPLARHSAEGREIVSAARAAGVKVGVNYQYRYDAGCYALARAAQSGALGEIRYARCNLPWHREERYFSGAAWHGRIETAGGGTLITQGSHLLDALLWAIGGRAVSATGYTARRVFRDVEVEDLAQGILEMESGALIEVCSSMVAHAERSVTIEVYGSRAAAVYRDRPWPHVRFSGAKPPRPRPPGGRIHALQRSVEGFRAWVAEDQPYLIPASEAFAVLAAVEAIYRSAGSGRREPIEALTP